MNVIDSNNLERDAGEKPVPTFSHPALAGELARGIMFTTPRKGSAWREGHRRP
jgi:hypothetical protein